MAGSYRPRPTETKPCVHCGTYFETRHKRAIYCGSSCRTLAYNARHGIELEEKQKPLGDMSFSLRNDGITAIGATAAAVGNYVFNDQPAQSEVLARLATMEKGLELGLNQMLQAAQYQVDFVNAMKQIQPGLQLHIEQIQQKRQLEKVERQNKDLEKQEMVAKVLARRKRQ